MKQNRREFLLASAAGLGGVAVQAQSTKRVLVRSVGEPSFKRRLAERELERGLVQLRLPMEVRLAGADAKPGAGDVLIALRLDPDRFKNPEAYSISAVPGRALVSAASEQALLYAVFDFLERQGAFFGIDGESYPVEPSALVLPASDQPWTASPRFAVRGLLPWPDFLNCISVYNREDFRAYFEAMLRMRFNTFGMHAYAQANQWAESYLSFEFAGVGHLAFLDNTAGHRWGYLPQRTSTFALGAGQLYDGEVFGSDATRLARDPWEAARYTREMLREAFAYAARLGIRTGIGFEPYQIPDEILRALPPEAKPEKAGERRGPRFDIESVAARKLLETRLAQLLEAYPEVDHVWLWEDEGMNWESRKSGLPLSVTPFLQAHDFLRRHAPNKRMVVSGWGGVARNFEDFHKRLPGDIVFSCLSDSLGWDPIHEVFGKLEDRERWPIPWLEDDPGMWLPQFHVNRFHRDLDRAAGFGCQGLLGIHWRHRIVDPTAGFQARFSWDAKLAPEDYYRAYAGSQASADRARKLAEVLADNDKNRKILCTFTGEVKDGHAATREFSGDYNEAFTFWGDYEPKPELMESQKQVAAALRALAGAATTPREKERIEYLARHVEFLVPYSQAWTLAHRLQLVLKAAGEARKAGKNDEARDKVREEGLPLWMQLAPEVRRAMLHFQSIVSTRNDLGTLASMNNKFVRLALVRLRLSMAEYLGDLPAETEKLAAQVTQPDRAAAPRLVVPTRPTMLPKGEQVRLQIIVAGGGEVAKVTLYTRPRGAAQWAATAATLAGRRTYQARLGPFREEAALVDYYVAAEFREPSAARLVAPFDAANQPYMLTLL
jgi:hypothetical protein